MQKVNGVCIKQGEKCAEAVAGVLLIGLHDMAFRDAIREDSRQTTPSRGVTPRKKFSAQANMESRVRLNKRSIRRRDSLAL